MGSQTQRGGKTSRGRYLLISKRPEIQQLFPLLSTTQLNDFRQIDIFPINKDSPLCIKCNYVYHNSKIENEQINGRDEYRIYFPQELDDKQMFEGDLIIMRRIESDPYSKFFSYYFYHITPNETFYKSAEKLLTLENPNNFSNYSIFNGYLKFFEESVKKFQEIQESIIKDSEDFNEANNNVVLGHNIFTQTSSLITKSNNGLTAYEKLFNDQPTFRAYVMCSYNNKCAVTGTSLEYENLNNVEAAHIWPRAHHGCFLPSNGIALRRDIHWAFDKGFFTLTDDFKIKVHEVILKKNNYLCPYNGKQIYLPELEIFRPDPQFIKHHQDTVFGSFLYQGTIKKL